MATRQEFCDAMIDVYKDYGVYIGTGNGEPTERRGKNGGLQSDTRSCG